MAGAEVGVAVHAGVVGGVGSVEEENEETEEENDEEQEEHKKEHLRFDDPTYFCEASSVTVGAANISAVSWPATEVSGGHHYSGHIKVAVALVVYLI